MHYFLAESEVGTGRVFGVSNISLVITYATVVIAALMLAGFLWMAFAYSGQGSSSSGYGRKKRDAFNVDQGTVRPELLQSFSFIPSSTFYANFKPFKFLRVFIHIL